MNPINESIKAGVQRRVARYQKWFTPIKLLILVLSLYLLYIRLQDSTLTVSELKEKLLALPAQGLFWAMLALLPLNLLLEMFRWWVFAQKLPHINFWQVFKGVFAGLGLGITIPQYLGDFGGRLLYLKSGHRVKGIMPLTLSNMAQFMVLMAFGVAGLWLVIPDKAWYPSIGLTIYWLLCLAGLLFPFRFMVLLKSLGVPEKWLSVFQQGAPVSIQQIIAGWILGHLRFVVFSLQFVFALLLMGYDISILIGLGAVWLIFLLKGGVPALSFMGDLGVREAATAQVFYWLGLDPGAAVAASLIVWFVNRVMPALIGLIWVALMQNPIMESDG